MTLDRITVEASKMQGRACVRGMRISVSFVLKLFAGGMSREQILHDHPDLELSDLDQCLEYAARLADEHQHPLPAVAV